MRAEQAGRVSAVGVAEHRAGADSSAVCVDLVVEKVQLTFVWITLFVDESHINGHRTVFGFVRESQIRLFVRIEIRVDRIVGYDGRQHARRGHEVARRDQHVRHAAVDRRFDLREFEIQPRRFKRGGGGPDVVLTGDRRGLQLIEILLRYDVFREQLLAALVVRRGQVRLCMRVL